MNHKIAGNMPPLECRASGSLFRMTPAQRKRANTLIRHECCNYDNGNCLALDDGDVCTCPQSISYSVCCRWFRHAVLPQDKLLETEIFHHGSTKRCTICRTDFIPGSNRAKYCRAVRVHRRQKANEKGGLTWTIRGKKSPVFQEFERTIPGEVVFPITALKKQASNCPQINYDKIHLYSPDRENTGLYEAPSFPV